MKQAEVEMKSAELEMRNAQIEMEKAKLEMKIAKKDLKKFEIIREKMIVDLQKDLKTNDIGSFKLDAKELIVNGQKQDEAMRKRYAKKYLDKNKPCITTSIWVMV
jgi:hypothetical protein